MPEFPPVINVVRISVMMGSRKQRRSDLSLLEIAEIVERAIAHQLRDKVLQPTALDLLRCRHRQALDKADPARRLVIGHTIQAPANDILGQRTIGPGSLRDNDGSDLVASQWVGRCRDRGLPNRGMAVQDGLDLYCG